MTLIWLRVQHVITRTIIMTRGSERRSHGDDFWSLPMNLLLSSPLRLWSRQRGGSNDATARQSHYYFSLSSDQIYIVIYIVRGEEGSSHQSVWESCAVPEWAAGPPRLELDWSHWAESRVLWGNSSFVLHAPLMMNQITRFYSRSKKRKLSSYFKLYHCFIRMLLLKTKT